MAFTVTDLMSRLKVRSNLELAYRLEGPEQAPVLLLITGLGARLESWQYQINAFRKTHRVLCFDNRGCGRSSVLNEPVDMHALAHDAILLMDGLGIGSAHVFGVSLGGKIALELALGWPERVQRLVLGCTSSRPVASASAAIERLVHSSEMELSDIMDTLVPLLFGRAYRQSHQREIEIFARGRVRRPTDPVGLRRLWEAHQGFDVTDRLPSLQHPTLIVTGDDDALIDPLNSVMLEEAIPHASRVVIPAAGHSFHVERPQWVNDVLAKFLSDG